MYKLLVQFHLFIILLEIFSGFLDDEFHLVGIGKIGFGDFYLGADITVVSVFFEFLEESRQFQNPIARQDMSFSELALVGKIDDCKIRKEIFDLSQEIALKSVRIKV